MDFSSSQLHRSFHFRAFFDYCYILFCVLGKRKDPGVPNSLPFKEAVLKELEHTKRQVGTNGSSLVQW